VMLIAVRGVLTIRRPAVTALAVVFIAAAGISSFLALRQTSVGPDDHAQELAEMRDLVAGEKVLFLGRDDFIGYELTGSDEITGIVANFYSVEDARGRFQKGEGGGEKFDIDALFPQTLDDFDWILATQGQPRSSAPPRFIPRVETENYVLWENTGPTGRRITLDEGIEPGAVLECDSKADNRIRLGKGTAQVWDVPPVIGPEEDWKPSASATDFKPASQTVELEPGDWSISLEYDSRRPLHVTSPEIGLDATIPANLDFRGPSPFFPVAEVTVDESTTATITVTPEKPNFFGRLLRAPNEAHLRSLSATPLGVVRRVQRRQMCDRYVDWYRPRVERERDTAGAKEQD